jgi:hypothetical protein
VGEKRAGGEARAKRLTQKLEPLAEPRGAAAAAAAELEADARAVGSVAAGWAVGLEPVLWESRSGGVASGGDVVEVAGVPGLVRFDGQAAAPTDGEAGLDSGGEGSSHLLVSSSALSGHWLVLGLVGLVG